MSFSMSFLCLPHIAAGFRSSDVLRIRGSQSFYRDRERLGKIFFDDVRALILLPLYQKDGYTLLRETYLKTPDDYRDSNYTIEN